MNPAMQMMMPMMGGAAPMMMNGMTPMGGMMPMNGMMAMPTMMCQMTCTMTAGNSRSARVSF